MKTFRPQRTTPFFGCKFNTFYHSYKIYNILNFRENTTRPITNHKCHPLIHISTEPAIRITGYPRLRDNVNPR